jgi:hypothetical protein
LVAFFDFIPISKESRMQIRNIFFAPPPRLSCSVQGFVDGNVEWASIDHLAGMRNLTYSPESLDWKYSRAACSLMQV